MNHTRLLESLNSRAPKNLNVRRYSLSEMISESYKSLYRCKKGTNIQKLAEAHLADVRNNPAEIDRLSRQLCRLNHMISMVESNEIEDFDVLVPEEEYAEVDPKEEIKESSQSSLDIDALIKKLGGHAHISSRADNIIASHPGISEKELAEFFEDEETGLPIEDIISVLQYLGISDDLDESDLGNSELTDEEVEELTKHLQEIRKSKKDVTESTKGRKLKKRVSEASVEYYQPTKEDAKKVVAHIKKKYGSSVKERDYIDTISSIIGKDDISTDIIDQEAEKAGIKISESKTWDDISLTEFAKKSTSKAFVRTFKRLDPKLREGTVLTRQESISLYKAANSAMTHLSVELEHNPEFLGTFKESVSLLSVDVDKLLSSLKEGKAPSIATMKSLAKFSEALLREEEEEELPPIEDEEDEIAIDPEEETPAEEIDDEENEEFDREYADARVELHKELADEHADSENPEVQDKLAQDAEEVINLPGITDEQVAEIAEEIASEDIEPESEEEEIVEESVEDEEGIPAPGDGKCPKCNRRLTDAGDCPACDHGEEDFGDDDITDDELEALKKYLTEMRKAKKIKESTKGRRLMRRK